MSILNSKKVTKNDKCINLSSLNLNKSIDKKEQQNKNDSLDFNYNLPWVEKYRPKKLNEIKGQDKIVNSLKNIIDNGSFPHLLFYGGSGSGKTSVILSVIDQYFGRKEYVP